MPVFELIVKDIESGQTEFTGRYLADAAERSKLVFNDNTVYVSPHNKTLNRYDGQWRLNDFVSTTPLLSAEGADLTDAVAKGSIIFGDAPSTATPAIGSISVDGITLPAGAVLTGTVSVDSVSTEEFSIPGGQTSADAAQVIAGAINDEPDYIGVNTARISLGTQEPNKVEVVASVAGTARNGDVVAITFNKVLNPPDAVEWSSTDTAGGDNSNPAVGTLTIDANNLNPAYTSVTVKVVIGTLESAPFTIDPTQSETNIAIAIRNALLLDSGITTVWTPTVLGSVVTLTSVLNSATFNDRGINLEFVETTVALSQFVQTTVQNMSGGTEATDAIPGNITFKIGNGFDVQLAGIIGGESGVSIATKAKTAFDASLEAFNYSFIRTDEKIDVTALAGGAAQNRPITVVTSLGVPITVNGASGGQNVFTQGALTPNTVYWYTARYVYRDGHKTKTSFPVVLRTGPTEYEVKLLIDLITDLDGAYADIEVFRKTGSDEFQFIDRFTPGLIQGNAAVYVDTGRPDFAPLDEQEYVWTTAHQTQELAQDRYIRANVSYSGRELPELAETATQDAMFEVVKDSGQTATNAALPFNVLADIYIKGKYEDGVDSFYKKLADIETDFDSDYLTVQQSATLPGIKDLSFWAKYKSKPQEGFGFYSIDFANINLPTTFSGKPDTGSPAEQTRPNVTPVNPRLFLGFNRIIRTYNGGGNRYEYYITKNDLYEFNRNESAAADATANKELVDLRQATADPGANHPDFITIPTTLTPSLTPGLPSQLRYYRVDPAAETTTNAEYRLLLTEPLQKAVYQSEVFVRLNAVIKNLSLQNQNEVGSQVKVIDVELRRHPNSPATFGAVYLVLEAGSPLDNIKGTTYSIPTIGAGTAHDLGAWELVKSYTGSGTESIIPQPRLHFTLVGFNVDESTTAPDHTVHVVSDITSDALYYLGRKDNTEDLAPVELPVTGFEYEQEVNGYLTLEYRKRANYNIFASLLTVEDLQELRRDFPNQIIWSEPFILGSSNSGFRNFKFINFLNITDQYGEIVDVRYHNTRLYVFTERGVANVNVGEVLANSASGGTFVDSSRFLSASYFILTNVPSIKPKSIVKYENMMFFCDGQDVWMVTDTLANISNGAIEFLPGATYVGMVDPVNKEYIITDLNRCWTYGFESQVWAGPHTFAHEYGATAGQDLFAVNGNIIVRHNDTNAFAGDTFESLIESTADDLDESSIDKLFRKFYLDYEGDSSQFILTESGQSVLDEDDEQLETEESIETFQYAKTYGTWTSPTEISTKNSVKGIGISKEVHNAKRLFWRFISNANDFLVRMVSFEWSPRNRR
jgi:hypothetical protein